MIHNRDCLGFLQETDKHWTTAILDPPDNIGLGYSGYSDKRPDYYPWLEKVVYAALKRCTVVWLTYYWKHDIEIKFRLRHLTLKGYELKSFIWRFTFGQHCKTDCGSGFRFVLRIAPLKYPWNTAAIIEES